MMKTVFKHTPLLKGESRAYVSLFLSGIRVYVYTQVCKLLPRCIQWYLSGLFFMYVYFIRLPRSLGIKRGSLFFLAAVTHSLHTTFLVPIIIIFITRPGGLAQNPSHGPPTDFFLRSSPRTCKYITRSTEKEPRWVHLSNDLLGLGIILSSLHLFTLGWCAEKECVSNKLGGCFIQKAVAIFFTLPRHLQLIRHIYV
jgi:hypothetical protein